MLRINSVDNNTHILDINNNIEVINQFQAEALTTNIMNFIDNNYLNLNDTITNLYNIINPKNQYQEHLVDVINILNYCYMEILRQKENLSRQDKINIHALKKCYYYIAKAAINANHEGLIKRLFLDFKNKHHLINHQTKKITFTTSKHKLIEKLKENGYSQTTKKKSNKISKVTTSKKIHSIKTSKVEDQQPDVATPLIDINNLAYEIEKLYNSNKSVSVSDIRELIRPNDRAMTQTIQVLMILNELYTAPLQITNFNNQNKIEALKECFYKIALAAIKSHNNSVIDYITACSQQENHIIHSFINKYYLFGNICIKDELLHAMAKCKNDANINVDGENDTNYYSRSGSYHG